MVTPARSSLADPSAGLPDAATSHPLRRGFHRRLLPRPYDRQRLGRAPGAAGARPGFLYLFSYYVGSSLAGSLGGLFWQRAGRPGVALMVGALLLAAVAVAPWLVRLPPLASDPGS
jgi:hypothetical protein